jgi:hypothetical protein
MLSVYLSPEVLERLATTQDPTTISLENPGGADFRPWAANGARSDAPGGRQPASSTRPDIMNLI